MVFSSFLTLVVVWHFFCTMNLKNHILELEWLPLWPPRSKKCLIILTFVLDWLTNLRYMQTPNRTEEIRCRQPLVYWDCDILLIMYLRLETLLKCTACNSYGTNFKTRKKQAYYVTSISRNVKLAIGCRSWKYILRHTNMIQWNVWM